MRQLNPVQQTGQRLFLAVGGQAADLGEILSGASVSELYQPTSVEFNHCASVE
jgi:hypothetical protein